MASGQAPPPILPLQPADGVTFIELPTERFPNDLHVLDVLLGGVPNRARLYRTSNGLVVGALTSPGVLRAIDLTLPVPFLDVLTNDAYQLGTQWNTTGAWVSQSGVANWNVPLEPPLVPIMKGKGSSQQGMESLNGTLYVGTRQQSSTNASGVAWNGLSRVSGSASPARAFHATPGVAAPDQVWTTAVPHQRARPEGTVVAETSGGSMFVFSTNYNGEDAAGWLHVQLVSDPALLDQSESFAFDVYELLGDWTSGSSSSGVYGEEVPRHWFTQSSGSSPGDKLRGIDVFTVNADATAFPNSGRQFLALGLNLDPVFPPQPLPVILECNSAFDENTNYYPMDLSSPVIVSGGSRDDGKYDYVALIDITKLAETYFAPVGGGEEHWAYDSLNAWKTRTKFIRLPPDFPKGSGLPLLLGLPCDTCPWINSGLPTPTCAEDCHNEGQDWSLVYNPDDCMDPTPPPGVLIVGSGSITGVTAHPEGTFLYVVTGDEDVENHLQHQPNGLQDRDGGWHMPHIYSIDMSQIDLTDQANLEYSANSNGDYPGWMERRRLNAKFVFEASCQLSDGTLFYYLNEVRARGPNLVADESEWIVGLPGYSEAGMGYIQEETEPIPYQLPDLGSGSPLTSDENYYIPTPRARPIAVRNDDLNEDPNRLYLGMNGWLLKTITLVDGTCEGEYPLWAFNVGAVMSFALPSSHNSYGVTNPAPVSGLPEYRKTFLLPLRDANSGSDYARRTMQVGGMDALPHRSQVLGIPATCGAIIEGSLNRNVLGVLAEDLQQVGSLSDWENRLVLIQDT